jgi:succinyl-CoA synthetase beta subunit
MRFYEYESKQILRTVACPCRRATSATTAAEAKAAAERSAGRSSSSRRCSRAAA